METVFEVKACFSGRGDYMTEIIEEAVRTPFEAYGYSTEGQEWCWCTSSFSEAMDLRAQLLQLPGIKVHVHIHNSYEYVAS